MINFLKQFFPKSFCSHEWEKLDDHTTESKFEHDTKTLKDVGLTWTRNFPHDYVIDSRRTRQTIFSCKKMWGNKGIYSILILKLSLKNPNKI